METPYIIQVALAAYTYIIELKALLPNNQVPWIPTL